MPRFAILEHDWPTRHWDLLLEDGDVLLAWRLLAEPEPRARVPAERITDHRKLYLDYEGPISGDRGQVRRWDWGEFEWQTRSEEKVEVVVMGQRIVGRVSICQEEGRWAFKFLASGGRQPPDSPEASSESGG